ncbi:MAG TPA: type II secretion system F family protein [Actinomycetes bacterium]|nr:type II secretion system F family protein [Actinomycetes bacterium]
MTPRPDLLPALLAGAALGAGLLLLVVAVRGLPRRAASRPPTGARLPPALGFLSRRGWKAAIAALLALVITRWPIAAVGAGLLTMTWHGLLGGAAEERLSIARIEALASWTESVRDTIAGAVGLEQAIPSSLRAAGQVMQDPLRLLVDRLRTRMPLPQALERFADELDDPVADLIVAALILNARVRGPGLREVLTALSRSAREELDMRRRVIAQRRSTRRSVQIVVGVTLVMVALLVLFNREYVEPYAAPEGQLVLVVVLAMFAAGFAWLKRLSGFDVPGRFLFGGAADGRGGGAR